MNLQKNLTYKNLKKLLIKNSIKSQGFLAVFGSVLGILLLFFTIELTISLYNSLNNESDFLSLGKKSSSISNGLSFLGLKKQGIPASVINQLKPYCHKISPYYQAGFKVNAVANIASSAYYSEFFVEAVDDSFLEEMPKNWNWKPEDDEVKIIIPFEYLALYNLGFAPSRGLPKLSTNLAKKIPFKISLPELGLEYKVKIAYFGKKINTILVSKSFVKHHNKLISFNENPNKIILHYKTKYFKQIKQIAKQNDLEFIEKNNIKSIAEKLVFVSLALVFLGLVLGAMALALFFGYFNNLLLNARQNINLLAMLGFHKKQVLKIYIKKLNSYFYILISTFVSIAIPITIIANKYFIFIGIEKQKPIYWQSGLTVFCLLGFMYFFQKMLIVKGLSKKTHF